MPIAPPNTAPPPENVPRRSQRRLFSALMDDWNLWLYGFHTSLRTLITNCYNNALEAYNSAQTAIERAGFCVTKAQEAAASAASCTAQGAAVVWVAGSTYAKNVSVIAPNGRTYRRITAGTVSNINPKDDRANYELISLGAFPQIHVQDQKAAGVSGDTLQIGHNTRPLNAVVGTPHN